MKLPLQAIRRRLIDDRTVRPVGRGRSHQVEVRPIAATTANLADTVAIGRLRADLYERLATDDVLYNRC